LIFIISISIQKYKQGLEKLKKDNERLTELIESLYLEYQQKEKEILPPISDIEANKQKIMKTFETRETITNDEVERLLKVSDSTASRYLEMLEEEGKITQIGKAGRYVYYIKKKF